MSLQNDIVEHLVAVVQEAESGILEEVGTGEIIDEPTITNRFLERIRTLVEEREQQAHARFRAYALPDRGPNSPESRFGADFCAVVDIHLSDYEQQKGFLAQAKKESDWISILGMNTTAETIDRRASIRVRINQDRRLADLQGQVWKMLRLTPDSFVIVYSPRGFVVTSASAIKGLMRNGEIHGIPVTRFFRQFLTSFIGDIEIHAGDEKTLEKLAEIAEARTGLLLKIQER